MCLFSGRICDGIMEATKQKKTEQELAQEEKVTYMTTAPVRKLVCKLAVPTIISMLVTSFYNMADTFFVGKLNTSATAAVGIVFSVMAFIQALGFFFGHGSGNYISRKLGAREYEEASVMAATGFVYAFLCGIFVAVAGLLFLNPLSVALGSTPTILPYTKDYLKIILLGAPFMTSSLVLNNQLRYQGSANYAMVGIVTGAVINIALDPLLIFTFQMGIMGAAVATVLSQIISFFILWAESRKGGNIVIRFQNFMGKLYYIKEIIRGGLPSLCRQGLASVSVIALNHAAGAYEDAAIAGMSIVSRVTMFANSALIGFGQGFQPVCGINYGAGKMKRVREAYFFCVKYASVFLLVVSVMGVAGAEWIVSIFRKDAQVIEVGTQALRLQLLTFPLGAWIVMCNMMLQSVGRSVRAYVVAAGRQGLFFLPLIVILPRAIGLLGVEACQAVADVCTLLLSVPLGLGVLNEMKKDRIDDRQVA